jgi:hypothetical protein
MWRIGHAYSRIQTPIRNALAFRTPQNDDAASESVKKRRLRILCALQKQAYSVHFDRDRQMMSSGEVTMKNKFLATVGAAAFAFLATSATASFASTVQQPGETMGLAVGAPLPEGVFAIDLEDYGHRDGAAGRVGVNIPLLVWATPFTFMDSRLQVLYAAPWTHTDGFANSRVDFYSQLFALQLAHDFGNGFGASILAGVRTPDTANYPDYTSADIRAAVSYTANGYNLTGTFAYGGQFGRTTVRQDAVSLDLTATKKFGKLEIGAVGYVQTDVNSSFGRLGNQGLRDGGAAVGGLIGYDFGLFTVQGMVTREVAKRFAGKDTRGWLRIIVPLYVAPKAPAPVVARY